MRYVIGPGLRSDLIFMQAETGTGSHSQRSDLTLWFDFDPALWFHIWSIFGKVKVLAGWETCQRDIIVHRGFVLRFCLLVLRCRLLLGCMFSFGFILGRRFVLGFFFGSLLLGFLLGRTSVLPIFRRCRVYRWLVF
ncbi:hypothetical protein IWX46DRAFT_391331 [Phyllosticta citricarpa]|uniref:Transmembrane protein n=1 Tax=Phyllosticta citricarpa TaxID=55181 RepID=A0ABR1MKE0_9PEZI